MEDIKEIFGDLVEFLKKLFAIVHEIVSAKTSVSDTLGQIDDAINDDNLDTIIDKLK